MNDVFSFRRLWLLIRRDFLAGYRNYLIASAAVGGIILIIGFLRAAFRSVSPDYYSGWYYFILIIGGMIIASFSFRELHDKNKNENFLLIPASALEKTVSRLLAVTVGFVAYLTVMMMAISLVTEGLNTLIFGRTNGLFVPFSALPEAREGDPDVTVWHLVGIYVAFQSIYFLGAAWFKKWHFIKTALSTVVIFIAMAIVAGLIGRAVFAGYFDGRFFGEVTVPDWAWQSLYYEHQGFLDALWVVAQVLFFGLVAPFSWFVAWLRVRETQVSYGV